MEPDSAAPGIQEKLVEDLKVLSKDVQELVKATASDLGDRAADARAKALESLKMAQDKLAQVSAMAKDKGQAAYQATDIYVRDNPWNAVVVAAGIGFLIGLGLAAAITSTRFSDE